MRLSFLQLKCVVADLATHFFAAGRKCAGHVKEKYVSAVFCTEEPFVLVTTNIHFSTINLKIQTLFITNGAIKDTHIHNNQTKF